MFSTGIVRRIDELGRVVIPMELRKSMSLGNKDSLEIFVDRDMIILRKYDLTDVFTGETEDLVEYNGKRISKKTLIELCRRADIGVTT